MVAGCPKCSARYRVDAERIGPDGAKLRCTKCSAVFLVRAPQPEAKEPAQDEKRAGEAPTAATPPAPPMPPAPSGEASADPARLVVVADPDAERGKSIASAIEDWGLSPLVVADGVEAMLAIQRRLPAAVILDAALPKMFGFQVCEVVKRNESLRDTTVVLLGAIHDQDRYRRDPSDLYGADVYLENPDVPDGLLAAFRQAGLPVSGDASTGQLTQSPISQPEPALDSTADGLTMPQPSPELEMGSTAPEQSEPEPEPVAAPEPSPVQAPPAADEDPERTAERERAERLARIAVSEMVLYQPDKFDQAARDGTLEQSLDLEIQEARALLRQRISEEVRAESDFIIEELNRVAEERSAQG